MGGDSNPWCLAAHTLSRRAQSTALSPIHQTLPLPLNLSLTRVSGTHRENKGEAEEEGYQSCNRRNNSSSGN
jgi:hypothetical protein